MIRAILLMPCLCDTGYNSYLLFKEVTWLKRWNTFEATEVRSCKQHLRARERKQLDLDTDGFDRLRVSCFFFSSLLLWFSQKMSWTLWHIDRYRWIWHLLKLHTHTYTSCTLTWFETCSLALMTFMTVHETNRWSSSSNCSMRTTAARSM